MERYYLIFLAIIISLSTTTVKAQSAGLYLLQNFSQGIIVNKNNSKAAALMNYDAKDRKMKFIEGEDLMLLTNTNFIDTVYIGSRKFIPEKNFFLEVVRVSNGVVYVDWRFKELPLGKKGALGITTQGGTIETVNTRSYRRGDKFEWEPTDVSKVKVQNEYWIKCNGKTIIFKNKKALLKQLPQYKIQLEEYIVKNSPDWNSPDDMVDLGDFCLGLE